MAQLKLGAEQRRARVRTALVGHADAAGVHQPPAVDAPVELTVRMPANHEPLLNPVQDAAQPLIGVAVVMISVSLGGGMANS